MRGSSKKDDDRLVTVCSACLCASCWHGRFFCDDYLHASTVDLPVSTLRKLNREHPDNYSVERVLEVCGSF